MTLCLLAIKLNFCETLQLNPTITNSTTFKVENTVYPQKFEINLSFDSPEVYLITA